MPRAGVGNLADVRRRIAVEAARLIAEQGLRDYHAAKCKAATRLGLGESAPLPRNSEIEAALREHQRLFQSDSQPRHLARLRAAAIDAMEFFERFEPRLVGPVLEGSADEFSAVCLHLFADGLFAVTVLLEESGIAYDLQDRQLRPDTSSEMTLPALLFSAGGAAIDATVFSRDAMRQAPLDRISGRPMRRANLETLRGLLAGSP